MAEQTRILHKVKERKRSKKGPDKIITECGKDGEVKGGWEFVNCPKCLGKEIPEEEVLEEDTSEEMEKDRLKVRINKYFVNGGEEEDEELL